jgi:hypothetical protein
MTTFTMTMPMNAPPTTTPPPTTTMRVALPRADALTDVLLSPVDQPVNEAEFSRVSERLTTQFARVAPADRAKPVRIDSYRLELASSNAGRLKGLDSVFSASPAKCRRAIGLAAVGLSVRDSTLAPSRAVERVLAESAAQSDSGAWWEDWYRRLPPGARAVAQAEAVTWATHLFEALDWRKFESQPKVGGDLRWQCQDITRVVLHGRVDVRAVVDGIPVFFVVSTGIAGSAWTTALALSALVAGMTRGPGAVPGRVVGFWPSSGQVRILRIDSGELDRASRLAVEAARILALA